jgi:GSCFA family
MDLQTKVEIPSLEGVKIGYTDQILSLGSCFAENIGRKLAGSCFDVDINPFGVLYNPVSIANSIGMILDKKVFSASDLFENKELWQSFSHSSLFSDTNVDGCLEKINQRLTQASQRMSQVKVLLITFGTAWVFEEKKSGRVVSNCHKLPAADFMRRRLTVSEIVEQYSQVISRLLSNNPALKIIFTVSPIRHFKDGAHENNLSKSTLLLAVNELQNNHEQVHYFPAYEIMMDELRDYRFYASDMCHPSEQAVEYIWERFGEAFFSASTVALKERVDQLCKDITHRPLHPQTKAYQLFLQSTDNRKVSLVKEYPFLEQRLPH